MLDHYPKLTYKIIYNLIIFPILPITSSALIFLAIDNHIQAIFYALFIFMAGLKFSLILIADRNGAWALSFLVLITIYLLSPMIAESDFNKYTITIMLLCSIKASYSTIKIGLYNAGIDNNLSNLIPKSLLRIILSNAIVVATLVSSTFFLLETPNHTNVLYYWANIFFIELSGPILIFRLLALFR